MQEGLWGKGNFEGFGKQIVVAGECLALAGIRSTYDSGKCTNFSSKKVLEVHQFGVLLSFGALHVTSREFVCEVHENDS